METGNRWILNFFPGLRQEDRIERKPTAFCRYSSLICLFLILHFSFFISSCIDDIYKNGNGALEGEYTVTTLRLNVGGISRADGTDPTDATIEDILFLSFDPVSGEFQYMSQAGGITAPDVDGQITLEVPLKTGVQDFYVLANAKGRIDALYPQGIPSDGSETKTALRESLTFSKPFANATSGWRIETDRIPMWGEVTLTPDKNTPDMRSIVIPLLRMLAKIKVEKVTTLTDQQFTLTGIYLYNFQEKGYLMPQGANMTGAIAAVPTLTGEANTKGPLYYAADDSLYTFETARGSKSGHLTNTCLVIEGKYKGSENSSFYRIDFIEKDAGYVALLRNHEYRVTITSIEGKGEDTAEKAFQNVPVDIEATIVAWERGYDRNQDIGGQDAFTLSESYFLYTGLNDSEGTPFTGSIAVNSTADWSYYLSTSPDGPEEDVSSWFTHTRVGNTKNDVINFTLQENMGRKRYVYIHFKVGNLTHVATICQRKHNDPNSYFLRPGGTLEFPVRKAYMVWEDDVMGSSKRTLTGAVTTDVIWQDTPNLVTVNIDGNNGNKTKIQVTARNEEGNAVVGVYVGGELRYSWHIWVTDYDPDINSNGTTLLYNNGYQDYLFMDRNMGATTATPAQITTSGFLYQWGRKDPFPGLNDLTQDVQNIITHKAVYLGSSTSANTNAFPIRDVEATANLPVVIQHPMTYYLGTGTNKYDWYSLTDTHNDYLWSDEDYDKGMFDPCPAGWRIPDWTRDSSGNPLYTPWKGWNKNNFTLATNGRIYNGFFYPCDGFRGEITGKIYSTGTAGYNWTASVEESTGRAYYLGFGSLNTSNVLPENSRTKTNGHAVRCVKE